MADRPSRRGSVGAFACFALGVAAPAFAEPAIRLSPISTIVNAGSDLRLDVLVAPENVGQSLQLSWSRRLGATPTSAGYLPIDGPLRTILTVRVEAPSFEVAVPAVFGPYATGRTYVLAAHTTDGGFVTGVSNALSATLDADQATVSAVPLPEGLGWIPANSGTSNHLWSVSFPDSLHGWIAGIPNGLLHTSDGGRTWSPQIVDPNLPVTPTVVEFVDSQTGWCSSNFVIGFVHNTSDGGRTWRAGGVSHAVHAMHFVDRLHGWAVGNLPTFGPGGPISRTTDGGRSWSNQGQGIAGELWAVKFLGTRAGIAVGRRGLVVYTTDGGATWRRAGVPEDYSSTLFLGVDAVAGGGVWIVGADGTILFSPDGRDFVPQQSGVTVMLRSVRFVTPTNGWVIGDGGTVLATFDAGRTWVPFDARARRTSDPDLFFDVTARSSQSAWAVGSNGLIRRFGPLE